MTEYNFPHRDAMFVLKELVDFDSIGQLTGNGDINCEFASSVLEEAAKLGAGVLAPLNRQGDNQGAKLTDKGVVEPPGFAEAYKTFSGAGWMGLTGDEAFGGQGLPIALATAVSEVWNSANLAFSLSPLLTQGAIEAIETHGSDSLKQTFLPRMITGEWSGTMNLTEPAAGSDLAALKTTARPEGDCYLINGQKIFITWGDHRMTNNIIHLVLARLPDAPPGVKGISLFVVPKFLPDGQGEPGKPNDLKCISVEHKLGIHGSPTCVMSYGDNGGATGYLVGEPHQGLMYMFTMMNRARQAVGLQGMSISERAYQQALAYARERLQGTRPDGSRFTIINFPDVRRMLMTMKSVTEAMRGFAYIAASAQDRAGHAASSGEGAELLQRVEFLTPIVKGWMTEAAQEITSLNIQVHGGMGYIEETGAAQFYRDARILSIYEGTTAIQANDLAGRKTLMNQGAAARGLLKDIKATADALAKTEPLANLGTALHEATNAGENALQLVLKAGPDELLLGAINVNYLMLFGWLIGGWVMGQSALRAQILRDKDGRESEFLTAKIHTAAFYLEHILHRIYPCLRSMAAGSRAIMALTEEQF